MNENSVNVCKACGGESTVSCSRQFCGDMQPFDNVDCAFYHVAPRCARCECRILDLGVEIGGIVFCCACCAYQYGLTNMREQATLLRLPGTQRQSDIEA